MFYCKKKYEFTSAHICLQYEYFRFSFHKAIKIICLYTVTAKIQGLRTTFREEVRKVKKSEHAGCGSNELYTPKWKFYNECAFLEEVVAINRPTCSNLASSNPDNEDDGTPEVDMLENPNNEDLEMVRSHPKRKRKSSSENMWMETAANALSQLATESTKEDEWDVFGKDIANSLRGLGNSESQRRAKFAIQSIIFQVAEKARQSSISQVQPVVNTPSFLVDLQLDHILQH